MQLGVSCHEEDTGSIFALLRLHTVSETRADTETHINPHTTPTAPPQGAHSLWIHACRNAVYTANIRQVDFEIHKPLRYERQEAAGNSGQMQARLVIDNYNQVPA